VLWLNYLADGAFYPMSAVSAQSGIIVLIGIALRFLAAVAKKPNSSSRA
jgi:hypothetical protein